MNDFERIESRKRLVALIGKFCNIKRSGSKSMLGGECEYKKLIDVGENHLFLEGAPRSGGGQQTDVEELKGIQEIHYREEKSLQGPFR